MKKIMFNDKYGMTRSVLNGRKTMARSICKYDRPNENYDIIFPLFESRDYDDNGDIISPLYGAFGWKNKQGEFTGWNIPKYKIGEVIAIAQPYKDILDYLPEGYRRKSDGWISDFISTSLGLNNKIFVRPNLMPHHIRIYNIKIERLQNISDDDCLKEGAFEWSAGQKDIPFYSFTNADIPGYFNPRDAFEELIDKISGKGTWESNPFVFVYEFELIN